jgi:pimeloyl-ACP methyl ester carboxylesterase
MTPAELRAMSMLGGHAFAGLVSRIEQVHQAIGGRAFGSIGPVSAPVRVIHDFVARGTYRAVGSAGSAASALGGQAASLVGVIGQRGASGQPAAGAALALLNAVTGDRLGSELAPLTIRMAVRAGGRDVELAPQQVREAFGDATPKPAVFVHGLVETEDSWLRQASRSEPYGRRLQAEFGYTPVYVRYNTGRHVSDNGRELARLLDELTAAWPVQVREILLVGHSMGGLVIRAACHYGSEDGAPWVRHVRHVFYLGSPHLGAPLARAAGLAGWALSQLPETRPFADLLTGSSGIRDLRHGYILDDWAACDPGGCQHNHRRDVPLLPGASHYAISAVITANPESPLGTVVGDLLVQPASAHGRRGPRQHIPFSVEETRRHGGMHHFDLLNHPDVWESMRSLLGGTVAAGAQS